ncbi:WxL domain-containing protein [Enterococcus sp. 5H]|uniref:WxL domain-containing protein n=1 Tax=Enterococcus sp. 5H TaxID=1229490 RepID=UPI002302C4A5|nr:WxL domain-containing protein [Enterococcus sp. 5H]MDA9472549.1 hypothetical protein [Enterococcus sp. 5H]
MKLTKLCTLALVATIGATTVGSVAASADEKSLGSTGTVTVTGGTIDPEEPGTVVDPENPDGPGIDPETPGVTPNPDIGSKGIIAVSDLNFGSIKVGQTSANAAAIALVDDAGTPTGKTRGNIVSFGDVTGNPVGYKITANLSSQFTNGTTTLDAATIKYTNPLLSTTGTGKIATAVPGSVTLSSGIESEPFISAAAGEGSGLWTLSFGQSTDYTGASAGTDASSVALDIPVSVASGMTVGSYTATVTWTMGATA